MGGLWSWDWQMRKGWAGSGTGTVKAPGASLEGLAESDWPGETWGCPEATV